MDLDDDKIEITLTYGELKRLRKLVGIDDGKNCSILYDKIYEAADDYYYDEMTKRGLRVYEE